MHSILQGDHISLSFFVDFAVDIVICFFVYFGKNEVSLINLIE